jgi:aspartate/methionine/tyrosine aminotransferase
MAKRMMSTFTPRPSSRHAALSSINIFAETTMMANKYNAVNLGQGFPSFGAPSFLQESLKEIMVGDEWSDKSPANLNH